MVALTSYAQKANFSTLDLENDLGLSSISEIASSARGYLYLANNEQVYLFDGKNADPISSEYSLPFSELKSLQEDEEGNLYLLANDQLIKYGADKPLLREQVCCFVFTDSLLFYGTDAGLKLFSQAQNFIDRPEALEVLSNSRINDLFLLDEWLYIASSSGLYKYSVSQGILENFNLTSDVEFLEIDGGGRNDLWAYDGRGTLGNIDLKNKKLTTFPNQDYRFTSMAVDSSGGVWFGSANKGILHYEPARNSWKTVDARSGLSDNRVVNLHCDKWGVMWVVTADGTLAKYIDRDYELYNVYDGLPTDEITAISAERRLLVGAGSRGIYEVNGGKVREFLSMGVKCEAILQDSTTTWVGTNGEGLMQIRGGESTIFSKNAGLPSAWVHRLAMDREGNLWVGTPSNGLAVLSKRDSSAYTVQVFNRENGLEDPNVSALHAMKNGAVYIGTQSGKVGRIWFGEYNSLPLAVASEITDLAEGPYGDLYIGTAGDGVWRLDSGKKGGMSRMEGYPSKVRSLAFLGSVLYVFNDKGVYTSEASFSTGEGFPSGKVGRGVAAEYEGRVWVASKDGLISVGQLRSSVVRNAPIIFLENVEVNYNPIPVRRSASSYERTSIDYNENQISFDYEGVNIHSTKDVEYSYILEGRDKMWSPWTKNDNPSFNNLRAGEYVFKVKAQSDGEAESGVISHGFVINGPVWKEWWFIPMIALLLGVIVVLLFRSRLRRVRRKNEEEKAQLEMKNRLLELEQKANQLQMNPHFIFNALNSIQATVAKEDYEDARKEITDFAVLMRSILANSKERTISLEDELKLLRKYIDIERKCRGLSFSSELVIGEGIDPEEAMIPPMLIQPFVENAIVHGLKGLSDGKLEVSFSLLSEEVMEVQVVDNGVGYDNSKAKSVRSNHKSVAIEVTKERLETLLDESSFPVLDIQQVSSSGGTSVVLKMPVEYNF